MGFSLGPKWLHEVDNLTNPVCLGSTMTLHYVGRHCCRCDRGHSPLLKSLLAHLSCSSPHLLGNCVFLSLGDLVHGVACVQPVRTAFATQTCSVSPPWEETKKIQVVSLIQTTEEKSGHSPKAVP